MIDELDKMIMCRFVGSDTGRTDNMAGAAVTYMDEKHFDYDDEESVDNVDWHQKWRSMLFQVVLSLIVIGACTGALVWSFIQGESGESHVDHSRDASKNFSIFVDQYTEKDGVYRVSYRPPDGDHVGVARTVEYQSFWIQSDKNHSLVHQISPNLTIFAFSTHAYWVNGEGQQKKCELDTNTNYASYIKRLGMTSLVRHHSEIEQTHNFDRVFIYQGNPDEVEVIDVRQTAFLVTTYADAHTGVLLGWDTYFAADGNSTDLIYELSYEYEEMVPHSPDPMCMDDELEDFYENIVTCFNCTLQIQKFVHIRCQECDVDTCLPCFQFGAESGAHKRGHNYLVVNPSGKPTHNGGWSYIEEQKLLSTMHRFKMGNWGEIVENMESKRRSASEAQEYFDKVFVRGWMGQFAIRENDWPLIKHRMVANKTLMELASPEADSILRLLAIRDALRNYNGYISDDDANLERKVQNILEKHLEKCIQGEITVAYQHPKVWPKTVVETLSDDDLDDSDFEHATKSTKRGKTQASLGEQTGGLEVEFDSEDETLRRKSEKQRKETPRSSKMSTRTKTTPKSKEKYNRIERACSSSEDEDTTNNGDEMDDGVQKSEVDGDDSSEQAEESDVSESDECTPPLSASKSSRNAGRHDRKKNSKRRRPRKVLTKKQRRLVDYRRKMARKIRKRDLGLDAINNLCPKSVIQELRDEFPNLALQEKGSLKERPKMRQDDLKFLAYNVDREEFEYEWFNEAEQLISRLSINPTTEKDEILDIENDIKFVRIQHYIRILSARKAKKRAIVEHDKITEFFNFIRTMLSSKGRTMAEVIGERSKVEALLARMQQFLTKEEHKEFTETLDRLELLTENISRLQELQRNGETTLKNYTPVINSSMKPKRRKHSKDFI
ncbi:unnamed protein product [Caenorhabditis auriculariae]|uniref:Myb-like domain-containing protein n=1 Tax=Caenorhabditis auriculariae TaxID=2777116 RepID=A0A8S1HQQ3_9PELO|nr:unnamed protein product [Caenorhabditis auriculariae]